MTKFEEEIKASIAEALKNPKSAFGDYASGHFCLSEIFAKAAAHVAKKYIEKAYMTGYDNYHWDEYESWLEENGIV